jgi:hypothetical protein
VTGRGGSRTAILPVSDPFISLGRLIPIQNFRSPICHHNPPLVCTILEICRFLRMAPVTVIVLYLCFGQNHDLLWPLFPVQCGSRQLIQSIPVAGESRPGPSSSRDPHTPFHVENMVSIITGISDLILRSKSRSFVHRQRAQKISLFQLITTGTSSRRSGCAERRYLTVLMSCRRCRDHTGICQGTRFARTLTYELTARIVDERNK